jgi:hypothetical protein
MCFLEFLNAINLGNIKFVKNAKASTLFLDLTYKKTIKIFKIRNFHTSPGLTNKNPISTNPNRLERGPTLSLYIIGQKNFQVP